MAHMDVVESFKRSIGTNLQSQYTQVHVLMIAWADDDLGEVDVEIRDLRAVFEKDYNYSSVSFFPIPIDGSQRRRLNAEISSFVENQSQQSDSLIIVYYAGHCSANDQGQAEWAAFQQGGPTLSWHVTQQLLFSAQGDVLLILDCCNASLITRGSKDDGGRFELIAASAKGVKTPVPGRRSFTRAIIRLLKQHADGGVSSESLASKLREDNKITETPVFHDFVRQSPTRIVLQRLQQQEVTGGFIQKPSGYLIFRASLSDDITGLQIAEWLKTAPPKNVTAVSIEAIVSRARQMQGALKDGNFPTGSVFEKLSKLARDEIMRCMRGLNTVMAATTGYAREAAANTADEEKDTIEKSLGEIEGIVSTVCTAVETPLLLDTCSGRGSPPSEEAPDDRGFHGLMAAADVSAALLLRQAILYDDPCRYSSEISRDKIGFTLSTHRGVSGGSFYQRRFKLGTIDGHPIVMETYKYKEAPDHSGEPYPQTLQQIRKITGLLCHPKRKGFHILPCAGFFRDRHRQELGLVFKPPARFCSEENGGLVTLLQLYKMHRVVPLGHRIHLAWSLATAIEHFHRVGWVHKSIRSNNIAFTAGRRAPPILELEKAGSQVLDADNNPDCPLIDRFDLSNPLLFGFEYSRAGDQTTYLDEDHSFANNLYRNPDRWGRPAARFHKSHDLYSLGVVLLEIALWKDVGSIIKPSPDNRPVNAAEVAKALIDKFSKTLPHQVGGVFAQCILTCLDFGSLTKGMGEYETQTYFQRNVTGPIGRAVGRV
ncbi:Fc.00g088400.m01.CDS01 [Cosmosporella sp. VM-42]